MQESERTVGLGFYAFILLAVIKARGGSLDGNFGGLRKSFREYGGETSLRAALQWAASGGSEEETPVVVQRGGWVRQQREEAPEARDQFQA